MIPTFKMHGSKARSAAWIVSLFPRKFDKWVEPFAGRGNVFFRMTASCNFHEAHINDINTAKFLSGLRDYSGDYEFVDEGPIDKQLWLKWKDSPESVERTLAESYVARFGSSYKMGPNTAGGDSKNGHSRHNTILRMQSAKLLLSGTNITSLDWEDHLKSLDLTPNDVVYLDPPYDVKQNVHFDNINHGHFVEFIKTLPCNVSFRVILHRSMKRHSKIGNELPAKELLLERVLLQKARQVTNQRLKKLFGLSFRRSNEHLCSR